MDETLREVIEYYVREGYELATLSTGGSATLARGPERIRLRLDEGWVLFDETPAAEPAEQERSRAAGWLAFVLAAAAAIGAAGLVLIGFALLFEGDDDAPDPLASATPSATPSATVAATATAPPTPTPTATPTATTVPPVVTALVASDEIIGPGGRRIIVDEVRHDAPFYVVIYSGDASGLGMPLAASALLAAGTHTEVVVPLPREAMDGEQLWVALHEEQNGNASFDGAAADRVLTDALTGSRGPQGEVAARITVSFGAPTPPLSGSGGVSSGSGGSSQWGGLALAALLIAVVFGTRHATRSRRSFLQRFSR